MCQGFFSAIYPEPRYSGPRYDISGPMLPYVHSFLVWEQNETVQLHARFFEHISLAARHCFGTLIHEFYVGARSIAWACCADKISRGLGPYDTGSESRIFLCL